MARYDWDHWRRIYVTGDDSVTLDSIASKPNAPGIDALKKYSRGESWVKQREEYRVRITPAVYTDAQTVAAVEQVNKIVDTAEMITRHTKLGKALQGVFTRWLNQYDIAKLKPNEAIAILKLGTDLERLCAGLATESIDLQNSDRSLEPAKIVRVVIDPETSSESEY